MFNLGFSEIFVLGAIALLVIGPKQLPEVARVVARTLNELKRATADLSGSFTEVKDEAQSIIRETTDQITDPVRMVEDFSHEVENSVKVNLHDNHDSEEHNEKELAKGHGSEDDESNG